ncbi:hypothetical protein FNB79_05930 [Formosa sediminum]|uniref:Uncharacterized protein n=1 Tax=Formosa sediminum TaxID=2594004 RepID=A0A516GPT2_9FLAO|nr:DUF6252 family protein [Formosa sediminum]QDO93535.1 hypothetical protein FNB79_05930 [Formosa sediminum]
MIKNWFVVVLMGVIMTSCGDNLEFNYPALQAKRDGDLWKTTSQNVSNNAGVLTINGNGNGAYITMELPELSIGTYLFGTVSEDQVATATATFTNKEGVVYSTLFNATDNLSTPNIDESAIYYAEGTIEINDINTAEGYISGEFWFTAYTELGGDKVDLNQGVFYEVPFVSE